MTPTDLTATLRHLFRLADRSPGRVYEIALDDPDAWARRTFGMEARRCPECQGKGHAGPLRFRCTACDGAGWVSDDDFDESLGDA